ncbi:MAG: hypothetical protein KAR42_17970 [candidate division Zixibacteria bacterium]|nr:hypothetical protein [candidate division Zixibacteria bacterium]
MKTEPIPFYVLEAMKLKTTREFKSHKRKELREIKKALDKYHQGCAYCPGYENEIKELGKILKKLEELQSIKEWGN